MRDSHGSHPPGSTHSSLPRYPKPVEEGDFPPPGHGRRQSLSAVGGAALSAATWAGWLGWDHAATYDPLSGQVEDPYVTLQVAGCVLTLAVLTVVLAAATRRPVPVAGGVSFGFWVPWTVTAVLADDSGLSVVGSFMVAVALAAGTAVAAMVGVAVRSGIESIRWRRVRRREQGKRYGESVSR